MFSLLYSCTSLLYRTVVSCFQKLRGLGTTMAISFGCSASTTTKLTWILALLLILVTMIQVHGQSSTSGNTILPAFPFYPAPLLALLHLTLVDRRGQLLDWASALQCILHLRDCGGGLVGVRGTGMASSRPPRAVSRIGGGALQLHWLHVPRL